MNQPLKICTKCGLTKPLEDFYKNISKSTGYEAACKVCHGKQVRENILKDHEAYKAYHREYYQKNKEKHRKNFLKATYGIDSVHWQNLFDSQEGCCAACGIHQSSLRRTLDTDHDHDTGEVRGLLCSRCNRLIGQAEEDIILLKSIIRYLEEHSG